MPAIHDAVMALRRTNGATGQRSMRPCAMVSGLARYARPGVLCQEDARASCCVRDEGRPFGAALQGEASNRQELLRPKPAVVNVLVKKA